MTDYDRPSFMVTLLDRDKTTAFIRNKFDNDRYVAEPMVVINGRKGLATVCTEGVGWYKDDKGYTILFDDINYIGMWTEISDEELASLISDEQTDLADFIRMFGDRLESNFYIWYRYGHTFDQTMVGV